MPKCRSQSYLINQYLTFCEFNRLVSSTDYTVITPINMGESEVLALFISITTELQGCSSVLQVSLISPSKLTLNSYSPSAQYVYFPLDNGIDHQINSHNDLGCAMRPPGASSYDSLNTDSLCESNTSTVTSWFWRSLFSI